MDVIVVTTNDLENRSTATELADDIYDQCGFGYGESKNGLLLLISMQDRDWAISTCDSAITAFTDAGIDYIGEKITPSLSGGDYAAAFNTFADLCDDFITKAKTGTPYTSRTLPKEPLSPIYIPVAIAIGLVLALIIVGCMKAKLKSVRFKAAANSYVKSDSLNVTESSDLFLYNTITRTKKPKDNDSGSSTHTSSSGTTHGGGSGKF